MPAFEQGDVIKVPFPYTDRPTRQSRPALVVSTGEIEELHGLLWVVMITSAQNRAWPKDVPVANLKQAGLPSTTDYRGIGLTTLVARIGRILDIGLPDLGRGHFSAAELPTSGRC